VLKLCTFGGFQTTDVACCRMRASTRCASEKLTNTIHQS